LGGVVEFEILNFRFIGLVRKVDRWGESCGALGGGVDSVLNMRLRL
jgi:hypothetical protein